MQTVAKAQVGGLAAQRFDVAARRIGFEERVIDERGDVTGARPTRMQPSRLARRQHASHAIRTAVVEKAMTAARMLARRDTGGRHFFDDDFNDPADVHESSALEARDLVDARGVARLAHRALEKPEDDGPGGLDVDERAPKVKTFAALCSRL
jgi:hypothetical protein